MNVTLNPELERLIEDEIKAGRCADPSDFVNKAVYHYLVAREFCEDHLPSEIDRMIAEGLADIERGNTIDGEQAFDQLRAYAAERRRLRG